jgi:hypothetical protein
MSVAGGKLPLSETEGVMAKQTESKCPVCGWDTIPIVYGLPGSDDFERTDIILGGCIVEETNPDLACSNCDWSGQEWHLSAPLSPSVWIILDEDEIQNPIGLVAGRFDEVSEVFLFGYWHNITFTKQYLDWLDLVDSPLALTAPFFELSPGLIAEFRIGNQRFSAGELYEIGFQSLIKPPRFELSK